MRTSDLPPQQQAARLEWWESAGCQEADPDIFFPMSSAGRGRDEAARAKAICAACQVRRQCLQFALATHQAHGVWGGTTEEERRLSVPAPAGARGAGERVAGR
jgi:WhiB family redox-sensing transcriptional regulator